MQQLHHGEKTSFTWDGYNRLKSASTYGRTTHFCYDALGRRIAKRTEGAHTLFGWDGDTLAFESTQSTEGRQEDLGRGDSVHYIHEPGGFVPLVQIRQARAMALSEMTDVKALMTANGGQYDIAQDPLWNGTQQRMPEPFEKAEIAYYQCDHLGTPQELTDHEGRIAWSASYKAWGQARQVISEAGRKAGFRNPIRFQGQYLDEETGCTTTDIGTTTRGWGGLYRRIQSDWREASASTGTPLIRWSGLTLLAYKRGPGYCHTFRLKNKQGMSWVSRNTTIELRKESQPHASVIGVTRFSIRMRLGIKEQRFLGVLTFEITIFSGLLDLVQMAEPKTQSTFIKTMQEKSMDTPKDRKHPDQDFDWEKLKSYLIEAYGNLDSPDYSFAIQFFFEKRKYPGVIEYLKRDFQFLDETEPNTDVSYGYILKRNNITSVLKISLVGSYFYLSLVLPDGSQARPSIDDLGESAWTSLIDFLRDSGFAFTSSEVLKERLMFGGVGASIYSILYSYEDEPSWVNA